MKDLVDPPIIPNWRALSKLMGATRHCYLLGYGTLSVHFTASALWIGSRGRVIMSLRRTGEFSQHLSETGPVSSITSVGDTLFVIHILKTGRYLAKLGISTHLPHLSLEWSILLDQNDAFRVSSAGSWLIIPCDHHFVIRHAHDGRVIRHIPFYGLTCLIPFCGVGSHTALLGMNKHVFRFYLVGAEVKPVVMYKCKEVIGAITADDSENPRIYIMTRDCGDLRFTIINLSGECLSE